jgi:hypothetical protein
MFFYPNCETKELEFWKYPELASSLIVIFLKLLEPTVLWKIKEPHNTGKDLEGGLVLGTLKHSARSMANGRAVKCHFVMQHLFY